MVRLIHLLMPIYEKLIDQSNKRASSTISVDIVLVFPMIASNGVVVTAPLFNPPKRHIPHEQLLQQLRYRNGW